MLRMIFAAGLIAVLPFGSATAATTAKQKAETCKAGADHEKLTGAKRKSFVAKCMAPGDAPAKRAKKPQAT